MTLFSSKNILHNLPYEAISVTVSKDTAGTETIGGKKVLKAGTLLGGVAGSIFDDRESLATAVTGAEGETVDGISLNDIDVTDRDAVVALVYRGTVREDQLAGEVSDEVKGQLNLIKFVKGI